MGGRREISPGKNAELPTDADAYTPARPTNMGFAAVGQLTRRLGRLGDALLSLGSVFHLRLPPDAPSRALAFPDLPGALVSLVWVSFVRTPRGLDFTLVFSFVHLTSLFCAHAGRTQGKLAALGAVAPLDIPSAPWPEG